MLHEDIHGKISECQFGGLPGTSAIQALVYLLHNWHMAMDNLGKVVRGTLLDFCKAFDLIDHNKLLNTFVQIGVRPALVGWFASYLQDRLQVSTFQGVQSNLRKIKGGVPQGSKLGPIAFIIKINQLPVTAAPNEQE